MTDFRERAERRLYGALQRYLHAELSHRRARTELDEAQELLQHAREDLDEQFAAAARAGVHPNVVFVAPPS